MTRLTLRFNSALFSDTSSSLRRACGAAKRGSYVKAGMTIGGIRRYVRAVLQKLDDEEAREAG